MLHEYKHLKTLFIIILTGATTYYITSPNFNSTTSYKRKQITPTPIFKASPFYKKTQLEAQQIYKNPSLLQSKSIQNITKKSIPTKKIPLCLIATLESQKFPNHSAVSVESISRSSDYVRLYIFTHQVTEIPKEVYGYDNVHLYDLGSEVAFDYDDKIMGFPRFIADRVCEAYGLS